MNNQWKIVEHSLKQHWKVIEQSMKHHWAIIDKSLNISLKSQWKPMTNNNCVSFIFPRGSLFRFNNLFDIIDATFVSKSLFCVVRLARLVMPSLQCRTSAYPSCKQGLSRAAGAAARAAGRHPHWSHVLSVGLWGFVVTRSGPAWWMVKPWRCITRPVNGRAPGSLVMGSLSFPHPPRTRRRQAQCKLAWR